MLYEAESVRRFVGLRLSDTLPNETTILHFRHLLGEQGLRIREGTIVDASIIEAPSSTKNRAGERGPEMKQGEKGEPIPLRDEGAHRGGLGDGSGAQFLHHPGQRV